MTSQREARTRQAFERLKKAVVDFELVTYQELARYIHVIPRNIGQYLNPIYEFCRQNGYPEINVLAVRTDSKRPAFNVAPFSDEDGEWDIPGKQYWCTELGRVFTYDWSGVSYAT